MTRTEENNVLLEIIKKSATDENATATYNEAIVIYLETIAVTLADISKSLAIIADKEGTVCK